MVSNTYISYTESCKLSHRHWEVTDGRGKTEVVDGEGVVGKFTLMNVQAMMKSNAFAQ